MIAGVCGEVVFTFFGVNPVITGLHSCGKIF